MEGQAAETLPAREPEVVPSPPLIIKKPSKVDIQDYFQNCSIPVGPEDKTILAFYGHKEHGDNAYMSNFAPTPFKDDRNVRWATAEHFLHGQKAIMFGDTVAERKILNTNEPRIAKDLGGSVDNFSASRWAAHRFDVMKEGLFYKFRQYPFLKDRLCETGNMVIVEAAPGDRAWGVGANVKTTIKGPSYWEGQNLLGDCLMVVRRTLQKEEPVKYKEFLAAGKDRDKYGDEIEEVAEELVRGQISPITRPGTPVPQSDHSATENDTPSKVQQTKDRLLALKRQRVPGFRDDDYQFENPDGTITNARGEVVTPYSTYQGLRHGTASSPTQTQKEEQEFFNRNYTDILNSKDAPPNSLLEIMRRAEEQKACGEALDDLDLEEMFQYTHPTQHPPATFPARLEGEDWNSYRERVLYEDGDQIDLGDSDADDLDDLDDLDDVGDLDGLNPENGSDDMDDEEKEFRDKAHQSIAATNAAKADWKSDEEDVDTFEDALEK